MTAIVAISMAVAAQKSFSFVVPISHLPPTRHYNDVISAERILKTFPHNPTTLPTKTRLHSSTSAHFSLPQQPG
jgi:hypothetical protein